MKSRPETSEQDRAERLSAAVDELLRDPLAPARGSGSGFAIAAEDEILLDTVRRLSRLPALLGPVDAALERRVVRGPARLRRVGYGHNAVRRVALPWAIAGLAVALLLVALLTPFGQTALAGFRAVFSLGQTEVHITPVGASGSPVATAQAQGAAVARRLTLEEARREVPFALMQPGYLPEGYELQTVTGYVYPGLPDWVPQPFSVELTYGGGQGKLVSLSLYPITLGDKERINTSSLDLSSTSVQDAREVDVAGMPGVLWSVGNRSGKTVWRQVLWEQGNLVLSLSSSNLSEEELLSIARSVR